MLGYETIYDFVIVTSQFLFFWICWMVNRGNGRITTNVSDGFTTLTAWHTPLTTPLKSGRTKMSISNARGEPKHKKWASTTNPDLISYLQWFCRIGRCGAKYIMVERPNSACIGIQSLKWFSWLLLLLLHRCWRSLCFIWRWLILWLAPIEMIYRWHLAVFIRIRHGQHIAFTFHQSLYNPNFLSFNAVLCMWCHVTSLLLLSLVDFSVSRFVILWCWKLRIWKW